MAKKIRDTDYLYISTRLKVLECNMLGREKLRRMAACSSEHEACKVLLEAGWPEVTAGSASSADVALAARRQEMLDLLYRYVPDRRIIDVFRLKYDYHNIKAIIKTAAQGDSPRGMLSEGGTLPSALVANALCERKGEALPSALYDAAIEAADLLAKTRDPQLSDMALDRAMLAHMLALAKETGSSFLLGYVGLYIDSVNLRVSTRALLAGKGAEYLAGALAPGGNTDIQRLLHGADAGLLVELYGNSPLGQAAQAASDALQAGAGLAALDKACDNALLGYLRASRFIPYGEAQVITYLLLIENELTSVRIVLAGKAAGESEGKIMEKLRLGYEL